MEIPIKVVNLSTGDEYIYVGVTAKTALICAHRQYVQHDFNACRRDYLDVDVCEGEKTFSIGDLCVLKEA